MYNNIFLQDLDVIISIFKLFLSQPCFSISIFSTTCKSRCVYYKIMDAANHFRKSDTNMFNLDSFFLQDAVVQARNSFTTNRKPTLDYIIFRSTLTNSCIPIQILSSSNKGPKKLQNTVKDKLSMIQEKLAKAKQQLRQVNQKGKIKKVQNKTIKQQPQRTIQRNEKNANPKRNKNPDLQISFIQKMTNVMPKPKNIMLTLVNPYSLSNKNSRYYVTEAVRAINEKNSMAVEHIQSSIQIFNYCTLMHYEILQEAKRQEKIFISCHPSSQKRKTLVLDLDQTLIHSTQNTELQPDLRLKVQMDNTIVTIDLNIRPHALTFLKKIAKNWEVIVFTASTQSYANAILDEIDPDHSIFHHRLYRQHCTRVGDFFIKDLSRLNRDLKNVVLVDNAAYSYILQLNNGIPILPFYDGKDYELAALQSYLQRLQHCADVRQINREYFKLQRYAHYQNGKQLIQQLYVKNNFHKLP